MQSSIQWQCWQVYCKNNDKLKIKIIYAQFNCYICCYKQKCKHDHYQITYSAYLKVQSERVDSFQYNYPANSDINKHVRNCTSLSATNKASHITFYKRIDVRVWQNCGKSSDELRWQWYIGYGEVQNLEERTLLTFADYVDFLVQCIRKLVFKNPAWTNQPFWYNTGLWQHSITCVFTV